MTARRRTFRWRAPVVAGLVAVVVTLASSLAVAPALADPLADKRAEARRLASEIDSLGQRVSMLAEDLDAARLEVQAIQARVDAAAKELEQAEQVAAEAKAVLLQAALSTYMNGGVSAGASAVAPGDVDPLLARQYAMTIDGRRVDALDAMRAQLQALSRRRASLADAQARARRAVATVEKAQRDSEAAAQRQAAVLARVQGDLVALVAEEQERREAADAAAAQAAVRRADARARQQAATQNSTATTARRARPSKPSPSGPAVNVPAQSAGAQAAVDEAKRQLGKPYRWGGSGPDSFDCSGLTAWAWRAGGRSLPHSSRAQYSALPKVPPSSAQPGDLFFFGNPIHHVGIYVGGGQMIAAPHSGTTVSYRNAYRSDLTGVGRP